MARISPRRVSLLTIAGLSLAAPAAAADIGAGGTCTGDPIVPDRVVTGTFAAALQGSYVMVPVTVPRGTEGVRVKYCYSQPAGPTAAGARNTLDLGLWDPRGFRGWGGSSHPDVTVSPLGFSSEAEYRADPRGDVPGHTTRGFLPGRVPPGSWEVELGVGGVLTPEQGNPSGTVDWRVEVDFLEELGPARPAYRPARYDRSPARRRPGWYTGDLHVHAEHSALGDATMREVFEYAFRPLRRGGAGLDFVTLTDYVTSSAWGEIGRHQADHPGRLIVRSAEVITYRGHTNNHASATYADHRLGPVHELQPDGGVRLRRGPRPPSELFKTVQRAGGFTQINHPRIFPSSVPVFALLCRGCPWDYSDAETDLRRVDAIELATGPATVESGDDPDTLGFTRDAIAYYQRVLATGAHVAAVAVSDAHDGGSPSNPVTERPIGQGATVVRARELSERGITAAVKAGHTYAKLLGSQGPDLRFSATAGGRRAIMGDTIRGGSRVRLRARVDGATATAVPGTRPYSLVVQRDGVEVSRLPVTGQRQTFRLTATGPGRWGLQLERGRLVVAVTTPIWVTP